MVFTGTFPRELAPDINPEEDDIEFQITEWYIPEADRAADHYRREAGYPREEGDPPEYGMFMYGVTADGHSIAVKVTDFKPYFFVKVPESWRSDPRIGDKRIKQKAQELETALLYERVKRTKLNRATKEREEYESTIVPYRLRNHLEYIKVLKRKEFYGFTNGEDFPFLKIRVKSLALFNVLKRYFNEPAQKAAGFKPYESNIDPFLRFIHERNLRPCGWVRLAAGAYDFMSSDGDGSDEDEELTRATINVTASADHVFPLEYNKIAPLLVASFDIECTSSHGDFPVARKDYRKLATDLIAAANDGTQKINVENIQYWITDCFKSKDTYISPDVIINQVYPIDDVNVKKQITPVLNKHASRIVELILAAAKKKPAKHGTGTATASTHKLMFADEGDADDAVGNSNKTADVSSKAKKKGGWFGGDDEDGPLADLTNFLTKYLPKLAGDAIIQIGTTVNRFGSDEIVYKHIVTLKSCDDIAGTDVERFETEQEVIMAWKEMIKRLDPDIITGYNIFGFDMKYVWERTQELNCVDEFSVGLGRLNKRQTILEKKELSSSALGDNTMWFFDMDGVVLIDMLKVMQRDHKLDSFKLDSVAEVFLGDKKDDIKPREIFEKFLGSSADRCDVARYCIQDCALVNRLLHKLKVLENNVGMGNVCSVPLSYLFMRGQGIKIFSLVAKECRMKQYLIPVLRTMDDDGVIEGDDQGYEGAIVLDPQEGMYLEDPITVLDYSSLYPSSMIARNLSHDCYVVDPESKYAKLSQEETGITYQTVSYDVYEGKGDTKKVVGERSCVFAQLPEGQKGIIPSILMKLLQQRKNTRKKIEYERLELSDGRIAIGLVKEIKEIDGGAQSRPQLEIMNVDQADIGVGFGGHKAVIDAALVVSREPAFTKFEQAVLDALQLAFKITANSLYGQIGSRTSPIYLKDIAACTTATGREMIMTAKNFVEAKYEAEVIYGDSVMPHTPITFMSNGRIYVKEIGKLYDDYAWTSYPQFKPQDDNITAKEQYQPTDMRVWTHNGWAKVHRVIRHRTVKKIYRVITNTGIVDITEDHSLLREDVSEIKPSELDMHHTRLLHSEIDYTDINMLKPSRMSLDEAREQGGTLDTIFTVPVPNSILNSDIDTLEAFLKSRTIFRVTCCCPNSLQYIIAQSFVVAQSYVVLFQRLGYKTHLKFSEMISVHFTKDVLPDNMNVVQKCFVTHESYTGYVYDLETEAGVFHAGVGNMIVKNTDSIFIKFTNRDKDGNIVKGKEALPIAIAAGQQVARDIKAIMPPPQSLEYEKTLWPFIIFSKKRYVGNLYEDDANKKPKQKSMGIVLKRRDNAPIVKTVYGGIIDILLNKNDLDGSVRFLREKLQDMVNGKIELQDLIISKTLRASYKDPTKIAHKVLARRMGERDAGNKPQANDRIPYVFIKLSEEIANAPGTLQGDRIEHPDYIRENCLTPDYYHYITNQLLKPICQMYALCVDKLPGYSYPPSYWTQIDIELSGNKMYTDENKRKDRIQALRAREVEHLLFSEYLQLLCPTKPKVPRQQKPRNKVGHALDRPDDMPDTSTDTSTDTSIDTSEQSTPTTSYTLYVDCERPNSKKSKFKDTDNENLGDDTQKSKSKATTTKTPRNCYDVHMRLVVAPDKEIWKDCITSNNKKNIALTHGCEHAFKTAYELFFQHQHLNENTSITLHVVTDKPFAKLWKSAFNNMESYVERYRASILAGDIGATQEIQELLIMENIVNFHNTVQYTLES